MSAIASSSDGKFWLMAILATRATIAVLLVLNIVTANTKQLSCSNGKTFVATEGHALSGHTISTHQVHLFPECHELCLEHPRCLSYNYQVTSTTSSHVCEINDATARRCPQHMIQKIGFTYYESKDVGSNFQVTFPRKSAADYVGVDLKRFAPPLYAFTVCLWLKTDDTDRLRTLFSYSVPNESNEILLLDYAVLSLFIASEKRFLNMAVNNGVWRHVCTTWENTASSYNLYIDGALLVTGTDLKTGHVIDNNGIFILGQDQDSYGGGFEGSQSFIGEMYGVNMWNRVLTGDEILHMSGNCSYGVGNYLRWSDFVTGLYGNVYKTSPATC